MDKKRKDSKRRILKDGESQRKDGRYIYRWTDDFGKRRTIYATSLNELRDKEKAIQKDILDGIDYSAGTMRFEKLLRLTISQKHNVKQSTLNTYKHKLEVIRRHPIASKEIRNIKPSDIKAFLIDLYEEGRKYKTIYEIMVFMKTAFNIAVDDDMIRKNPIRFKLNTIIRDDNQERTALTSDEKARYLNYLQRDNIGRKYYDVAVVLIGTGLRISELCGLTKHDIDFQNKEIYVTRQLEYTPDHRYVITVPKTKTGIRTIPMSIEVAEAFKRILNARKKAKIEHVVDGISGFLFISTRGTLKTANNFDLAFRRLIQKYNETYTDKLPHITPHVLRHTFCTDLLNAGMNPKYVQYLMGHSKIEITMNVYAHANTEAVKDAFAKIIDV